MPIQNQALEAIRLGRAKCVAGVVYRTSEHVIEPWPGNVRCISDVAGTFSAVESSRVLVEEEDGNQHAVY